MKLVKTALGTGIALFFVWIIIGCEKQEIKDSEEQCLGVVEGRGNRHLAFDILDLNETGDFDMNYHLAAGELKSDFIQLLQPWNALENLQKGHYNGDGMQLFESLGDFAASTGMQLSLIIAPVDISGRFLPEYLSDKKFNDPLVIEGFKNLIDAIFNHVDGVIDPDRVIALSVGNEIDHYNWVGYHDQLSEYEEFLQAIKGKVNGYGIPLHFTGTLYGMTQNGNDWVDLAEVVDKVSVTYYPVNPDYTVKPPGIIESDINTLVLKFAGQSLFFQEIGYPSSAYLNSSEALQADFFCQFFKAWDRHKDQITHVGFLRLNDVSIESAERTAVVYGLPDNKGFVEYIRTLGIRTWEKNGTHKKAFETIKSEVNRREW